MSEFTPNPEDEELDALLEATDGAILAAIQARLEPESSEGMDADSGRVALPGSHDEREANEAETDEALNHLLTTTDDALLSAIERRTHQHPMSKDPLEPARPDGSPPGSQAGSADSSPVRTGPVQTGTVMWFNVEKGYGYIRADGGHDVFVHYSAVQTENYRTLEEGQRVEFHIAPSARGPMAADVRLHHSG